MLEILSQAAFDRDVGRLDARLLRHRDWTLSIAAFPVLDVTFGHPTAMPLRLRLDCTDWDDLPPAVELLHADGRPVGSPPPNVGNIFHPGPHPATGRVFVCMRGAREFHTHPSHLTEAWEGYRGQPGMDLLGLVGQIWRSWKGAVG